MRTKIQHLVMLIAIFSGSFLASSPLSAQKKTTKPAAPEAVIISVSGSTNTVGANTAEEQNHCFKRAPTSDLNLTISSVDINNHPYPKNGRVTVEIINLNLLGGVGSSSLSKPGDSQTVGYESKSAPLTNGKATVNFKGDTNPVATERQETNIHLGGGSDQPVAVPSIAFPPYSNLALITISSRGKASMKHVWSYQVWTSDSSECTHKP